MKAKGHATLLAVLAIVSIGPALAIAQTPVGRAFTYQGQLKQAGSPFTGTVDFDFLLWADPNSVDPAHLKGSVTVPAHEVTEGLFTVELDFGPDVFIGEALWLEIVVNGTPLSPRQPLTATPFATYALDGPWPWFDTGTDIYFSGGNVGIGTTTPTEPLSVAGSISGTRLKLEGNDGNLINLVRTEGTSPDEYIHFLNYYNRQPGASVATANFGYSSDISHYNWFSKWTGTNERLMTIDASTGNVGIGVNTPAQKLEVDGTAQMDGFKLPTGAADGYVLTSDALGVGTWQPGGGACLWTPSGDDIYNNNAGNVGIGTSMPTANLEVSAGTDGDAVFRLVADIDNDNENDNPYFVLGQDGLTDLGYLGLAGTSGVAFDDQTVSGARANALILYRRESQPLQIGTNGAIDMTIEDGNVGIGTDNPLHKLHVSGDSWTTLTIEAASNDPQLWLTDDASVSNTDWLMVMDTSMGNELQFRHDGITRVAIEPDGDVGIGTLDPLHNLHVKSVSWASMALESVAGDPVMRFTHDASDTSQEWTLRMDESDSDEFQIRYGTDKHLTIDQSGNVGIGTSNPTDGKLQVETSGAYANGVYAEVSASSGTAVYGWNQATSGSAKGVEGRSTSSSSGTGVYGEGRLRGVHGQASGTSGVNYGVYGYSASPDGYGGYFVGRLSTDVLEIRGGSDLSEQFDVDCANGAVTPGMVVCIDPNNPGQLVVSTEAYDRKVAGVVSGAGGVKPGMLMGQRGSVADGEHPIALTGRVYVYCDASSAPIQPGDLLTTSDLPGHAMKVSDHAEAQGAIIGKAMTTLESGHGLVLVLVSLQ
jgi:hypothetical protein